MAHLLFAEPREIVLNRNRQGAMMNKYIVIIGCAVVMAVLVTVLLKSTGISSGFVIGGIVGGFTRGLGGW